MCHSECKGRARGALGQVESPGPRNRHARTAKGGVKYDPSPIVQTELFICLPSMCAGGYQYWVLPHEVHVSKVSRAREDNQHSLSAVWGEGPGHALTDHPGADPGWRLRWADTESPHQ